MIQIDDLYNATNHGLDIILAYYPQARECVDNGKHFKIRDEATASACIKLIKDVYRVTDFGGEGRAYKPIDIVMKEDSITFGEAVCKMAAAFGVADTQIRESNRPDIRKTDATPEQADGSIFFELEEDITPEQMKVMGPKVTREDMDFLNWHVAKSVSTVKNRVVTTKLSTPTYPIFIRECIIDDSGPEVKKFFKIYEPLNPDKGFRFSYAPRGAKPAKYTNGLYELKKQYDKFNASEEADWDADPRNEGKPYILKKLPEVFICSGERDSLCLKSEGYFPVWFNSETSDVSQDEIQQLSQYAQQVYNIPDIDSTGIRMGTKLALQFIHMKTVWLQDTGLSQYRDARGKPRKDFRDWVELHPLKSDFQNLLTLSMPACFWTSSRNEKTGKWTNSIEPSRLLYFLELNGFRRLEEESSGQTCLVHISGSVVRMVEANDITDFLIAYSRDFRNPLPEDIRSLLLTSERVGSTTYNALRVVKVDQTNNNGPRYQYWFFSGNTTWKVTPSAIETNPIDREPHYVFEDRVINHKVKILPDMFHITKKKGEDEGDWTWDIQIDDISSCKSCSLKTAINTSRLHWKKSYEAAMDGMTDEDAATFRKEHQFAIDDPGLDATELQEQKQALIAKIFTIGYMLHRYKAKSKPWAPIAMDYKFGELGDCNGGSGKSFFFDAMKHFLSVEVLSGKDPKLMDNRHAMERVNDRTDMVYIDDCDRYFNIERFYDMITGDMVVNPKNNKSFRIPFDRSPKLGFSTNYVPERFDPSSMRRCLYVIFSDWYHEMSEDGNYRETRTIRSDFGKELFSDYTEEEWNWDINFYMQCLRFYLECSMEDIKITPPLTNIIYRRNRMAMGANFEEWATMYFMPDGDNVNVKIVRQKAFEDFSTYSRQKMWTMNKFTNALRSFAYNYSHMYILNPTDMCNAGPGRIVGRDPENNRTTDFIYMQCISQQPPADQTLDSGEPSGKLPF